MGAVTTSVVVLAVVTDPSSVQTTAPSVYVCVLGEVGNPLEEPAGECALTPQERMRDPEAGTTTELPGVIAGLPRETATLCEVAPLVATQLGSQAVTLTFAAPLFETVQATVHCSGFVTLAGVHARLAVIAMAR